MATSSLVFDLFGRDRTASSTINTLGDNAERMGGRFKKVGVAIGAGLAAVGAGLAAFAVDSVKEYAKAEEAQRSLKFAFEKFPALADTNQKALQKLNTELQKKTRFDDDNIASGQAVLAQFKLTGSQITQVTPLLLDYASKTGKDVPEAAQDLGKALLGNAKALKNIGIFYKSTGDATQDFTNVTKLMRDKVGGFAETEGTTAAGKLDILKNRFGEVQEKVGEKLLPVLTALMDYFDKNVMPGLEGLATWITDEGIPALSDFKDWVVKYKDALIPAGEAVVALLTAQRLLNVAMAANPIGAVVTGLIAAIAIFVWVGTNLDDLKKKEEELAQSIVDGFANGGRQIGQFATDVGVGVLSAIGWFVRLPVEIGAALGTLVSGFADLGSRAGTALVNGMISGLNAAASALERAIKALTGLRIDIPNLPGLPTPKPGPSGSGGVYARRLAEGGLVKRQPGGVFANIGEGSYDEAVVPLSPRVLKMMQGGGGPRPVFNVVVSAKGGVDLLKYVDVKIEDASRWAGMEFDSGVGR